MKTIKFMGKSILLLAYVALILFGIWVLISFLNVNTANLDPDCTIEPWTWNFFNILIKNY
jgi:hypothetical protein